MGIHRVTEPPATSSDASARPSRSTNRAAPERFELSIKVQEADIDQLGHVNNVVYVRWVQDAAVAHWRALATPAQQAEVDSLVQYLVALQ